MTVVSYTVNFLSLPWKVLKQEENKQSRYEPDCREDAVIFLIIENTQSVGWGLVFFLLIS